MPMFNGFTSVPPGVIPMTVDEACLPSKDQHSPVTDMPMARIESSDNGEGEREGKRHQEDRSISVLSHPYVVDMEM